MAGFQERLDAIAKETQRSLPALRSKHSIPHRARGDADLLATRKVYPIPENPSLDRLRDPSNMSTSKGRSATFSDMASEGDAASVSTSTYRRAAGSTAAASGLLQRDRSISFLNMKRGSTLYFGKDITTSMWWKYRQIYDGVGALRGNRDSDDRLQENSYRLEPKSGHKFAPGKVEDCIRQVLATLFANETYDPKKAAVLAEAISDTVKQRVKSLEIFDRYRFVVNVDIGSRVAGQEVIFASRYLWNTDTDGFATVTDQNRTMYVIVTVYGIYLD